MLHLSASFQNYAWGSPTSIPELLGDTPSGRPVAEAWFGAHPSAPSAVDEGSPRPLDELIADRPHEMLGEDIVARFGVGLPYLLKLIAADHPLSLQVHPHIDQARAGYAAEDADGIPVDAPWRNYRDRNHKPELVYALSTFEALCGFRAPRRAAELFASLGTPLAKEIHEALAHEPSPAGVQTVFRRLVEPDRRPSPEEIREFVDACAARLEDGSPSPRADRIVVLLQDEFPGDPGVVTSMLLNPVTLQPGEAMFVPAGGLHAYLRGLAVEVMASSDNVLRAGLTAKHVDVPALLDAIDYVAAPPIRIAPEVFQRATRMYYAPVDDFQLSVTCVEDDLLHPLPGRGPRIVLCLEGAVTVHTAHDGSLTLQRGRAAFVPAEDGPVTIAGRGLVVQADVP